MLYEAAGNMHMHTPYSDGEKYHAAIAEAALDAGLDFIIVTDHNIWIDGLERVAARGGRCLLLLVGEEVHDNRREPQANHLLVYGAERELAAHAADPQRLIDAVNDAGGLCFLAHPHDIPLTIFGGIPDLGWHAWHVERYTGLELWNYMSSFSNGVSRALGLDARDTLPNRLRALRLALDPAQLIDGPEPATLAKWDELLASGRRVPVVGNSDVHGTPVRMGPIRREIFPYDYCFRAVNTHILLPQPLTYDLAVDKAQIYAALRAGRAWIGYDLPASTRGFRFHADGPGGGSMGDSLPLAAAGTLVATTPAPADIRLVRHGAVVAAVSNENALRFTPQQPGAYRVECTIDFRGRKRGWIYSNPIYLT